MGNLSLKVSDTLQGRGQLLVVGDHDASGMIEEAPRLAGLVDSGFTRKSCDQTSQERAEFFFTEPGIADDAAHRERIDRIVPGDGDDPDTVGHHDVLALLATRKPAFCRARTAS